MLKNKYIYSLLLLLLLNTSLFAQAQSQEELIKTANNHFEKKEYTQAAKLFSQLVSTNGQNPEFNYKYGACLIYTSDKKEESLKYLQFAVGKYKEVNEAHFYLARAYHISYRFNEAIALYSKFKATLKPKELKKYDIDLLIKQCESGKSLIDEMQQIKVISSKKLRSMDFFRGYALGKMDRKILLKPVEFQTPDDKNAPSSEPLLVVHGPTQENVYFSGYKYGTDFAKLDKDIFWSNKLPDGTWSDFKSLGPFINTNFDEDYPYLHPNGKTLYFSSKGHGGLGGYDIYKSELDTVTDLWGTPQNLGFSINSPFDDILYIVDQDENAAFFASNRSNKEGEITVYKIIPQKKRDNYVIVKGDVKVEGAKSNACQMLVSKSIGGEIVGKFSANPKTGSFLFSLGELETYNIELTFADSLKHQVQITTPAKNREKIIYKDIFIATSPAITASVNDKLNVETTEEQMTAVYDQLAKLDKNQLKDVPFSPKEPKKGRVRKSPNGTVASPVASAPVASPVAQPVAEVPENTEPELSPKESAAKELAEVQQEKQELKNKIDAAYVLVEKRNQKTNELKLEIEQLNTKKDNIENPQEKKIAEQELIQKNTELNLSVEDASTALNFAQKQEANLALKNKEEQLAKSYVDALNLASKPGNSDAAIKKLENYQKEMELLQKEIEIADKGDNLDEVKKNVSEKKNERQILEKKVNKANSDLSLIKSEKNTLENQLAQTKKKALKEEISLQIKEQESEIVKQEATLDDLQNKLLGLNSEIDELASQLTVIDEIESESVKPSLVAYSETQKSNLENSTKVNQKEVDLKSPKENSKSNETSSVDVASGNVKPIEKQTTTSNNSDSNELANAKTNGNLNNVEKPLEKEVETIPVATINDKKPLPGEAVIKPKESEVAVAPTVSADAPKSPKSEGSINTKEKEVAVAPIVSADAPKLSTNEGSTQAKEPETESVPVTKKESPKTPANNSTVVNAKKPVINQSPAVQQLTTTDLNAASQETVRDLSKKVLGINAVDQVPNRSAKGDLKIQQSEVYLKEALVAQQELEKTKLELANQPENKSALNQKIELLDIDVSMAQSKWIAANKEANLMDYNANSEQLDMQLFLDPKIENIEITKLKNEILASWSQSNQEQNNLVNAKSNEEKSAIYNSMLSSQAKAIQKQEQLKLKIEQRIKDLESSENSPLIAASPTTSPSVNPSTNTSIDSNAPVSATDNKKEQNEVEPSKINVPTSTVVATTPDVNQVENSSVNKNAKISNDKTINKSTPDSESPVVTNVTTTNSTNSTEVNQNTKTTPELDKSSTSSVLGKENYTDKAEKLKLQAENTNDPFQKQQLYDEAKLYEIASDPIKLDKTKTDVKMSKTLFSLENPKLVEAKKYSNINLAESEAIDLENRAYELFEKANAKLKESQSLTDTIEVIKKINEAEETYKYALLKQEQALKKYKESSNLPDDPIYEKLEESTASNTFKDSFEYNPTLSNESLTNTKTNNITDTKTNTNTVSNTNQTQVIPESNVVNKQDDVENQNLTQANPKDKAVKNSPSDFLIAYEKLIKEANQIEENELKRLDKIKDLRASAKSNKEKSEKILAQTKNLTDPTEIKNKINEANNYRELGEKAESEANSEEYFMNNSLSEAKAKREEAKLVKEALAEKELAQANKIDNKKPITKINQYLEANVQASSASDKDGIELSSTKIYNTNTVIPLDVKLPEGLIYKVQVGAFKNKIDPSIFNGISPLTGELTGLGFTRYTAGLFRSFKAADMAKGRIRNLGYKDAFVVVFYNGKRISMDEADRMMNDKNEVEKSELQTIAIKEVNQLKQAGIREEEANTPAAKVVLKPKGVKNNLVAQNAVAQSINNLEGIYFTVQVGVYKNAKTSEELFNIEPLQTFTTDNGLIRYSTGVYRVLSEAETRKAQVVNIGVLDAYVVAYKNGQRISVEEATGVAENVNTANTNNVVTLANKTNNSTKEKAVFKVQLGAYKSEVDIAKNTFLNQLTSYGIQFYTTQNGFYIYSAGEFTSKAKADELKQIVLDLGIKDAFVVAYNSKGQKISVKEALALLKN